MYKAGIYGLTSGIVGRGPCIMYSYCLFLSCGIGWLHFVL